MRILHICESYPPHHNGGAETSCKLIVEEQKRLQHEVFVITNDSGKHYNDSRVLKFASNTRWGNNDFSQLMGDYERMLGIVSQIKPDVIHLHIYETKLQAAILLCNEYPVVYTAHNYSIVLPEKLILKYFFKNPCLVFSSDLLVYIKHLYKRDRAYIEKITISNIEKLKYIIAPSEFMQKILAGFGINKVCLVYNGVENRYFANECDVNLNKLLYVGRIEKEKGIKYLLYALQRLKKEDPTIKLEVIGEGAHLKKIKQLSVSLGVSDNIEFSGQMKYVDWSCLDGIFILPSVWDENCSMSIIEALSAGKNVICTDVGGNSELISDLYSGLLVEKESANAIYKKVLILRKYPSIGRFLSRNSRRVFRERFTVEGQVQELIKIYKISIK
jgi:glycosyltransferase involved in cell wall biosynthesis